MHNKVRLGHNTVLYVGFGSASTLCWYWLHYSHSKQSQVKFSFKCHINQTDINLSHSWDKSRTQGKHDETMQLYNTAEYSRRAVNVAPHEAGWSVHQLYCGYICGGSFLSETDGDCTFIFQSNNQTTSPFSGALRRWGGRLQSQADAVTDASQTHLLRWYTTALWWRSPNPICLAVVRLNTDQN